MSKVKVVLTLTAFIDLNGTPEADIKNLFEGIPIRVTDEGLMTGCTTATVETGHSSVIVEAIK